MPHPSSCRRWSAAAALLDAVLIVLFAALGRASHEEGVAVVGTIGTAAPFLAGAAVGWLGVWGARRRAPLSVVDGVAVWACTVVLGMVLRQLTGQGTAASFVVVATVVLGAFLLGWRVVRAVLAQRTRHASGQATRMPR